jgi:hypothetical protein
LDDDEDIYNIIVLFALSVCQLYLKGKIIFVCCIWKMPHGCYL